MVMISVLSHPYLVTMAAAATLPLMQHRGLLDKGCGSQMRDGFDAFGLHPVPDPMFRNE